MRESKMRKISDNIKIVGDAKSRLIFETLKLSASQNAAYSLAANQIGMLKRVFTVHRHLKDGLWLYPDEGILGITIASPEIPEDLGEEIKPFEIEMSEEHYEIYVNPKIVAITDIQEYGWER